MTLADSLKQALAFEEGWLGDDNFVCGMRSESARLSPLHAALADVVALFERTTTHDECEDCFYSCPKHPEYCGHDTSCNCGADERAKALARLGELLGEGEGK